MINCQKCIDFLIDYLDGELPEEQRKSFETHLKLCPPCMDYVNEYRRTIEVSRAALKDSTEKPEPCCHMPEALVQAIIKACKQGKGETGGCGCDQDGKK
ncbi:MAG: hypothetical protein GC162_19005 [Planctomycetes bacterium]|nr:hypothetical protein [Planctomycetota bacterium]